MIADMLFRRSNFVTITICCSITVAALISCGESSSADRFADTYADILVVRSLNKDSVTARHMVDSVMSTHGFTRESFKAAFKELMSDPAGYRAVLDSARARAQRHSRQ